MGYGLARSIQDTLMMISSSPLRFGMARLGIFSNKDRIPGGLIDPATAQTIPDSHGAIIMPSTTAGKAHLAGVFPSIRYNGLKSFVQSDMQCADTAGLLNGLSGGYGSASVDEVNIGSADTALIATGHTDVSGLMGAVATWADGQGDQPQKDKQIRIFLTTPQATPYPSRFNFITQPQ
jgi:hypothetical protein